MSEVLSNTGVKLWAESDYSELWLTVFDQLTGQGGKSNIRLIDEAIGKINGTLDGYKFEFSSDEDRLYISKGDSKLPVSLIDSNGHVASKVDGTTITIDESGVVKGIPVDDALSEESTNPLQNKVIAGELKNIKSKMSTDESTIESNTKRIEANETAISTLNGTGDGSVKKAVSDGIAKVVAGAPEDFDTLKEMSDWISSHESSASAMNTQIQNNKEAISGHVSNADVHFTSEERTKLKGVEVNANKTVVDDKISDTSVNPVQNKVITAKVKEIESNVSSNTEKINSLETEVSNLPEWSKSATKPTYTKAEVGLGNVDNTADANKSVKYATSAGNATKVNNHTVNADVPSGAKFTDTTYGVATITKTGIVKPDGKSISVEADGTIHALHGKYLDLVDLGTSYTADLKADISSGKFEIARVGGFLTINSHVYLFAHPDYWLHCGEDTECTTHHMVVVPLSSSLISGKMNNSNVTTGGYLGSDFKTGANSNTALADIKAIIKTDFGASNILTHREFFTNAVTNGKPSGGAWADSDIDLMNEIMVYGCPIFTPANDGSTVPPLYTTNKTQLELFAKRPDLITTRGDWWLRDVVSSVSFAYVASYGNASNNYASNSYGIRPAFAIC